MVALFLYTEGRFYASVYKENMTALYNQITSRRSFQARAQEGSMSTVVDNRDGTVTKTDMMGGELVPREFRIMLELIDTGLVPEVDEDSGVTGWPASFTMRKINNGASLGEYLECFLEGLVPFSIMEGILAATAAKINTLHEKGYLHGDLHDRNVVVEMDGDGDFQPFLIDFGLAFHEDESEEDRGMDRSLIESMEEDSDRLVEALYALTVGGNYTLIGEARDLISRFASLLL